MTAAVLRYLYGLPLLDTEDRREYDNDYYFALILWRNLASEDIAFGIPSLSEHAQGEFETTLEELLVDKTTGHLNGEDNVRVFMTEAHAICLYAEGSAQESQPAISKA